MKKFFVLALIVMVTLALSATAFAVGPGKTVEFGGKGAGKVIFDGKAHAGAKCAECHSQPKLFAMKKGAETLTMKDMDAGKFCGACHNGTKAFSSKDCAKCHKK
jgi:c(7)-type cytochrome triheme protein